MAPRKTPGGGPKPDKLMRDALALELHQEVKLTTGEKVKKLRLVARTLVDKFSRSDPGTTFAAIRRVSSRVRLIARQAAVRRGDYVGNRGKCGSARLALETTFMSSRPEEF